MTVGTDHRPDPSAATLRVVELVGSVAGGYAAKLLADRGASVTAATTPWSSPPDRSQGSALYLDRLKTTLTAADDEQLAPALDAADVVIQSSAPGPLVSILDRFPPSRRRIDVEISPFGRHGPYRNFRSTDLTDQAISGHLFLNGDPDRPPLQGPDHQVAYAAGTHAAIGVEAALASRAVSSRGQRVEVTHHEVMTALHQFTLLRYTHNGDVMSRMGNRYAGPGHPAGLYRCGDGLISLIAPRGDQLETLVTIAGLDHLLDRDDINNLYDLMHHPTLLDEHLAPWLAEQDLTETVELLQAVRVPATTVSTMADLLADQHLEARQLWTESELDGQTVRTPRSPALVTVTSAQEFGADTLKSTRDQPTAVDRPAGELGNTAGSPGDMPTAGPLAGIRVLDLTRVWAGPCATRIMADLGADVIMIEAPWARGSASVDHRSVMATRYYPDNDPGDRHWNRIGFSNKYNINKRNVAIDLGHSDGRTVLERLIVQSDVLIENYSPRVMPQFGFDEEQLHRLNPELIYVTMPGFGRSGPSRDHVAYGPVVDSQAGLSVLMGYPGEGARKAGVAWPDPVAGIHAAYFTMAALNDRAVDGRGRTIELAQIEATVAMVGHAVADRQIDGVEPTPIGNGHRTNSPNGVYPCAGEDRWLAIAVVDQRAWIGLCRTAGFDQHWQTWDADTRRAEQATVDRAITRWTGAHQPRRLMKALQDAGVPAALVADAADIMADQHHEHRGFFVELDHPEAGPHRWPKLPISLSVTPATYRKPGPNLNQHADEILGDLAGFDEAEIAGLRTDGVISDRPPD